MALDPAAFILSQVTYSLEDFTTPTSNDIAVGIIESKTLLPQLVNNRVFEEIFLNSAAGQVIGGTVDGGIAGGQTLQFIVVLQDPDNVTDVHPNDALRALHNNSVAGTSVATYDYSSPLTLGGKLEANHVFTIRNNAGNASTITFSGPVVGYEPAAQGEHMGMQVTLQVTGTIAIAAV